MYIVPRSELVDGHDRRARHFGRDQEGARTARPRDTTSEFTPLMLERERLPPRRHRELEKVPPEELRVAGCRCCGMEEPAKEFARPQDLTAAGPTPSRVGRGQVEELQGAGKRACPALSVSLLMPADSPVHFAADVGELRNERHRMPSAAREIRVNRGGRPSETRSVTAARMRARMESST